MKDGSYIVFEMMRFLQGTLGSSNLPLSTSCLVQWGIQLQEWNILTSLGISPASSKMILVISCKRKTNDEKENESY